MNTSKLEDQRVLVGGGAVAAILLIAASWLLFIHPRLASAADLRSQTAAADQQNSALVTKNAQLAKKYDHLDSAQSALAKVSTAIPAKAYFPQFTREAYLAARALHVDLTSIAISAPTPVSSPVVATTATTDGSSTDTSSADTSSTDSSASTAAAGSTAAGTATGPSTSSIGAAAGASTTGVAATQFEVPVTFLLSGDAVHVAAFPLVLQKGSRAVLVTSEQLSEAKGNDVTATVQATIFTVPMSTDQAAALRKLLQPTN